jgi:RES domain-containing protein
VYSPDTPAGALLEVVVHTDASNRLKHDYVLFEVRVDPDDILTIGPNLLPNDWRADPWPASTQEIGTFWHRQHASVVLEVPSAVVPHQRNYLVNVVHPNFEELEIQGPDPFEIDSRLT